MSFVPLAKKYDVAINFEVVEDVDRHIMFLDITVDSRFQLGVYI